MVALPLPVGVLSVSGQGGGRTLLADGCRLPTPDLVEFQEDTGGDVVTDEAVGMVGAGSKYRDIEINVVVTGRLLVNVHEQLGPPGVVDVEVALAVQCCGHPVVVALLEHEHVRVDPGVSVQWSNAHAWVDADERSFLLPLRSELSVRKGGEEDEKADIPEGG